MSEQLYVVRVDYVTVVMAESEDAAHDVACGEAAAKDLPVCSWYANLLLPGDPLPEGWNENSIPWGKSSDLLLGVLRRDMADQSE